MLSLRMTARKKNYGRHGPPRDFLPHLLPSSSIHFFSFSFWIWIQASRPALAVRPPPHPFFSSMAGRPPPHPFPLPPPSSLSLPSSAPWPAVLLSLPFFSVPWPVAGEERRAGPLCSVACSVAGCGGGEARRAPSAPWPAAGEERRAGASAPWPAAGEGRRDGPPLLHGRRRGGEARRSGGKEVRGGLAGTGGAAPGQRRGGEEAPPPAAAPNLVFFCKNFSTIFF